MRSLGTIALASREGVELVDLAACRVWVLARGVARDVRFSPDARWVAYWRSSGDTWKGPLVVSVHGGPVRAPLGAGIVDWSWAPNREVLYGITAGGSLVSASPTGGRRVVSRLGKLRFGLTGLGISPDRELAVVDRSRCGASLAGELDTINLRNGARAVALRQHGQPVIFAGFSPGGRWLLFWLDGGCSSSLAADGMLLEAVPATGGRPARAVGHMLLYDDFLTWCSQRLIAAAGPDRETQSGSALVQTSPPTWLTHTIQPARKLSWVSPSCAPSGRVLAAAAGPSDAPTTFGLERRSIWLLRPDGAPIRRLASPSARGLTYEAPRFSRNGRWVMFVRTRVVTVGQSAISRDTIELVRASGKAGPLLIVNFASDDFSYYDHFDWPDEIAWSQPQ